MGINSVENWTAWLISSLSFVAFVLVSSLIVLKFSKKRVTIEKVKALAAVGIMAASVIGSFAAYEGFDLRNKNEEQRKLLDSNKAALDDVENGVADGYDISMSLLLEKADSAQLSGNLQAAIRSLLDFHQIDLDTRATGTDGDSRAKDGGILLKIISRFISINNKVRKKPLELSQDTFTAERRVLEGVLRRFLPIASLASGKKFRKFAANHTLGFMVGTAPKNVAWLATLDPTKSVAKKLTPGFPVWDIAVAANGKVIGLAGGRSAITLSFINNAFYTQSFDTTQGAAKKCRNGRANPNPLSISISRDGAYVAAHDSVSFWLWRTGDGKLIDCLKGESLSKGIREAIFLDGGKLAVASSRDVTLWTLADGKVTSRKILPVGIDNRQNQNVSLFSDSMWASPDGRFLAVNRLNVKNGLSFYTADGTLLRTTNGSKWVKKVAFGRDGEGALAAVSYRSGTDMEVFRLPDSSTTKKNAVDKTISVISNVPLASDFIFLPGETKLAVLTESGRLQIYDVFGNGWVNPQLRDIPVTPPFLKGFGSPLPELSVSPDGRFFFVGGGGAAGVRINAWNDSFSLIKRLRGHDGKMAAIAAGPKGQYVATAATSIHLWSARTGGRIATIDGEKKFNSERIELGTFTFGSGRVSALLFSEDGKFLYSGHKDGFVRAWNVPDLTFAWKAQVFERKTVNQDPKPSVIQIPNVESVYRLFFANDNQLVAEGDGRYAVGVDARTGKINTPKIDFRDMNFTRRDGMRGNWSTSLPISFFTSPLLPIPDTNLIVGKVGFYDALRLFDTSAGKELFGYVHRGGIAGYTVDPENGDVVFSDNAGELYRWEATSAAAPRKQKVADLIKQTKGKGWWSIAFSPEGSKLMTLNSAGDVYLWAVSPINRAFSNPKLIASGIGTASFDRTGKRVLLLYNPKVIDVWSQVSVFDIKSGNTLRRFRSKQSYREALFAGRDDQAVITMTALNADIYFPPPGISKLWQIACEYQPEHRVCKSEKKPKASQQGVVGRSP